MAYLVPILAFLAVYTNADDCAGNYFFIYGGTFPGAKNLFDWGCDN